MLRIVVSLFACCVWLGGCKEPDSSAGPGEAPVAIERVARMKVEYVAVVTGPLYVAADTVDGQMYNIDAVEEFTFHYDGQNRLIRHESVQTNSSSNQLYTYKNQYSYVYANGRMTETQTNSGGTRSFSFTLDSTQSRVLSYTKRVYGDNLQNPSSLDTLRQYSPDGILQRVLKSTGNLVITIDKKNISRIEEFNQYSGVLSSSRTFAYDMDHGAPSSWFTFLGETSRNAVTKETTNYVNSGSVNTYVSTYRTEYDAKGRIIKRAEFVQYPGKSSPSISTINRYYY